MKRILFILLTVFAVPVFSQEANQEEESIKVRVEKQQLVLPSPIVFRPGTSELTSESEESLQSVLNFLTEKNYISLLRIESYTDNTYKTEEGQMLTEKRALTVARWLVAHGIECNRLVAVGFGNGKPIADNATRTGRVINNRINFALAGIRGKTPSDVSGGGKLAGDLCQ